MPLFKLTNGTFCEESLENMDEEAALLSVVPEFKIFYKKNGIFYKNNDNRKYEFLKTYKEILRL